MTVEELDAMPAEQSAEVFRSCCGSSRWVSEMVTRRPFGSVEAVMRAADESWDATQRADWHEAFSHHPRIGERQATAAQSSRAAAWSSGEQAGIQSAPDMIQDALADANREYEDRFGHIYIVCAAGKTAGEMLVIARARLSNDPETELRIAAEEQRKITHIRLKKLFGENT